MKFPDKFYLAIMSSFKGRARGALLGESTWMCSTPGGFCHWSTNEDEKTIFMAKGSTNRFILEIYKSFENQQKGSLEGHPSWVYNAGNTCFNYTSVEKEATQFKLVSVPVSRGGGYALEILKSYENRGKGTDKGHRSWMYNDCKKVEEGVECVFGYTSVESEATGFSICEYDELPEPTHVVDIVFDMDKKIVKEKPWMLLQATYVNKSDIDLTMDTKHPKETKKTRVFEWSPNSLVRVGANYTITCEVPFVTMSGDVGFDESGTFLLGKENGEENTEKQKWILPFPGVIPSKTSLTFGASVTQGRLEVPFIAILQSGERQWKEEGTLTSTNCFSLRVDCFGVKVDSNSYNSL